MGPQVMAIQHHPGDNLPELRIPEKISGKEKGGRHLLILQHIQNFHRSLPEFVGREDQTDRFLRGIGPDNRPFAIRQCVRKRQSGLS